MRHFIFLGLILLLSCSREQEFFEGEILYKISISPGDAKIGDASLQDVYGDEWHFYFKNGNFRWDMQSKVWIGNIYNQKENKFYYRLKDSEIISWKKGKDSTDLIISVENSPSEISILGHRCDVFEIKTKVLINDIERVRQYYYSSDLKVKPEWFKQNKNGNFDAIYNVMRALPLKIVDDFGDFTITYEATQIIPKELDDSLFTIDPDSHLYEIK